MGIKPRLPGPDDVVVLVTADNTFATADMTTWTADGLWEGTVTSDTDAGAAPRLTATAALEI